MNFCGEGEERKRRKIIKKCMKYTKNDLEKIICERFLETYNEHNL
jgi:hypothetical protein